MGMLSLADILLTDAQVSYKENRIIIYFQVNAEVNLAFKEHIQSLYNRFIKQETILVTIEEHSFESHIISLASAAMNLPLQLKTMAVSLLMLRNRGLRKPVSHR